MDTELGGTQYLRGRGAGAAPGGVVVGGRYQLRGVLGRGAMAEVRDGWDLRLGRPVAVKLLYPGADDRLDSRLRFATEARAAAQLTGRHVVVVHDVGEHDGRPFIVMERLPGVSLADHIERGPLPPAFVHAVLDVVLHALAEAHRVGILHRDVKRATSCSPRPANPSSPISASPRHPAPRTPGAGEIVGSMAYLSPERLASKPATVADDLYAVGVVGYEALTGRRPFPQEELGALARAILHNVPPPVAALRPDVPPVLAAAIERAMARDPAWRFDHAGAIAPPFSSSPPTPANTTTPLLPPPTTTLTTTPSSTEQQPPPHPGKKPKCGRGD